MKRLIRKILVFAFLSCVTLNAFSYDFEVDGIYYNYNAKDQTAIVTHDGIEVWVGNTTYVGNIIIPEYVSINGRSIKVAGIGESAFWGCERLESVKLPENITSIGRYAFGDCPNLRLINIPSSIIEIGQEAFMRDSCLTINTDNEYTTTSLNSLNLSNVKTIGYNAFGDCIKLEEVTISASNIPHGVFYGCSNLKQVNILSGVHDIMSPAFKGCPKDMTIFIEDKQDGTALNFLLYNDYYYLTHTFFIGCKNLYMGRAITIAEHVSIFDSLKSITIGEYISEADLGTASNLEAIYSKTTDPDNCKISFNNHAYVHAKLYVPIGCKEKYSSAEGWKNFFQIEEMDVDKMWNGKGEPDIVSVEKKCEKPSISYSNGKLTFTCSTEGATCMSTITDTDVRTFSGDELQLSATYTVKAYATAAGYDNSETVTATLCWLDAEPKTEGMTNDIASVKGDAILIQSDNGTVFVSGAGLGEKINIYSSSGVMVASTKTLSGTTALNTNLKKGEIAIVKIGSKSVKVLMQ